MVPQACGVVWDFVRRRALTAGRNIALYLNANIDVEAGVEVASDFEEEGEIVRSSTPAGVVVSAIHFGPYQNLGIAHEAIHACVRPTGISSRESAGRSTGTGSRNGTPILPLSGPMSSTR